MADEGVIRQTDINQLKISIHPGIPTITFVQKEKRILDIALSKVADDGYTFLQVARRLDMCAANFVAPAPVGGAPWAPTVDQTHKHGRRVNRLYEMMISYISIDSEIYREYISPDWIGFGVNVYEHFCNKMTLAMDTGTLSEISLQWTNLDWKSTHKIKINRQTIISWMEMVLLYVSKFPAGHQKTEDEIWEKFISGCPTEIHGVATSHLMTPQNRHRIPAVFGAFHPRAGVAHPNAGEKCIKLLAADLNTVWLTMIRTKQVMVKVDQAGEDIFFAASRSRGRSSSRGRSPGARGSGGSGRGSGPREMTLQDVCYKCGGIGHMARVKKGGEFVPNCPTTLIIDKDMLTGIQYKHMANPRKEASANMASDEPIEEDGEQCNESSDETEDANDVKEEVAGHLDDGAPESEHSETSDADDQSDWFNQLG